MTVVSLTAVGAFDAVGSILVIALMIVPAATAYLLTDRLPVMILLSLLLGVTGAISGYWLAWTIDTSISGAMVTMLGLLFGLVFLFSPERGMVALARRRVHQKWDFAQTMLVMHLANHQHTPEFQEESRVKHLQQHLRWRPDFAEQVIRRAEQRGFIRRVNGTLALTPQGELAASRTILD
jgi:manganese/zinc/iron transport system permease protein